MALGGLPGGAVREGEMKGLSLRNYPVVLRELRGAETADRMASFLPADLRAALEARAIAATAWYPVAWKRALHGAGQRATGEPFLARVMGAEMTRRDLTGIYGAFVRVVSPRYVLHAGARIFGTYLRPGKFRAEELRRGFVRVHFTECRGFDQNMWMDVIGGCEATLQVAGATSVRLHVQAGGRDNDDSCTVNAWWTDEDTVTADAELGERA
jgi:hypothetical protein